MAGQALHECLLRLLPVKCAADVTHSDELLDLATHSCQYMLSLASKRVLTTPL